MVIQFNKNKRRDKISPFWISFHLFKLGLSDFTPYFYYPKMSLKMKTFFKVLASALLITATFQTSHADQAINVGDSLASLNKALTTFSKASIDGDIETILAYTYPPLFDLVPREQMQAGLEQMLASEGAPEITNLETKVDDSIQKYSQGIFTKVTADTSMNMKSPDPENTETNEFMLGLLQEQMGDGSSVAFDNEKGMFHISKSGTLVAINEDDSGWKFIDYDQALAAQATTPILPKEIAEKLSSESEE